MSLDKRQEKCVQSCSYQITKRGTNKKNQRKFFFFVFIMAGALKMLFFNFCLPFYPVESFYYLVRQCSGALLNRFTCVSVLFLLLFVVFFLVLLNFWFSAFLCCSFDNFRNLAFIFFFVGFKGIFFANLTK